MLIMKKSRKRDPQNQFRSRFDDTDVFPLRQYLRCRDEMIQKSILLFIQSCFAFAYRVHQAFQKHVPDSSLWLEVGALSFIMIFVAVLIGRVIRNIRNVLELRADIQTYRNSTDRKNERS
jgi:uncharacterized membrane protein YcjF (UPF0283 family)